MSKSNDKALQEFLENQLRDNPNMSMDEFAKTVEWYSPRPDVNKLISREHRNKACRIARKVRNNNGDRRVYANKKKGLWVDVEHEIIKENLIPIRKKLEHQAVGNRKAYNLVTKTLAKLAGQTVLEFEESEGVSNER